VIVEVHRLEPLLFGVTGRNMTILTLSAGAVTIISLIACYVPVRRATRVDPLAVLKTV